MIYNVSRSEITLYIKYPKKIKVINTETPSSAFEKNMRIDETNTIPNKME